ncbi:MAG: sulfotransferase family protein [Actinomycetes bacterium]
MKRTLLLVTGAGRSGTSTAAGAMALLGLHVPGPFLGANQSNPKGFYESKWSVEFHNRLLKRAAVSIADGRPDAQDRLLAAVRDADRAELRDTLQQVTESSRISALKDPRTTWTLPLWRDAADDLGVRLASLTMLRHPAEVLGSRATHYKSGLEELGEEGYAARNLAGWVNAMLMAERGTRGLTRSFVRYDDLLSDWRDALSGPLTACGAPPPPAETHPVDEFIDPDLSRHRLTWADLSVPDELRAVADDVWSALSALADARGADETQAAQNVLDDARTRYDAIYDAARQLVHDAITGEATLARRAGARAARKLARNRPADGSPAGSRVRSLARRVLRR